MSMEDPEKISFSKYHKRLSEKHGITQVSPGTLTKNLGKAKKHNSYSKEEEMSSTQLHRQESSSKSAMVLTSNEGILELHVTQLTLTELGIHYMRTMLKHPTYFRVFWNVLDFEPSSTGSTELEGLTYHYNLSLIYKVDVNENFLCSLAEWPIVFQLLATDQSSVSETFIARGELSLSNLLHDPKNKFHSSIDLYDIDVAISSSDTSISKCYGSLSVWYQISEELQNFAVSMLSKTSRNNSSISQTSTISISNDSLDINRIGGKELTGRLSKKSIQVTLSNRSIKPTSSEYQSFQEALQLTLNRNKALRTTQSEISNEIKDRAKWLREEADWRRTLQEYAILKGEDPHKVMWRQWRDESTAKVRLRNYPSVPVIHPPVVTITVNSFKLFPNAPIFKNQGIKSVYVEYSFLSREGPEMESKSASISKDLVSLNFEKTFYVDLNRNSKNCGLLANMIKSRQLLRFAVIGEPAEDPKLCQNCEKIGTCIVDLFQLVQLEENVDRDYYPIKDASNATEDIGYLEITFSGILAMRRTALLILSPPDYDIIV